MNGLGKLVQLEINQNDEVLELGCGVMGATSGLRCKKIVGVDAFQEYVDFLHNQGIEAVLHDLTVSPYPFADKSFDSVLLLDILEHMNSLDEAAKLISEAKRISRKHVFVFTPEKFSNNKENFGKGPYETFNQNDLQLHHVLINRSWLEDLGFKVKRLPIEGGSLYGVFSVKSGLGAFRREMYFLKDDVVTLLRG